MGCVASKAKKENLELELEVGNPDNKMAPIKRRKVKPYLLKRMQRQLNANKKILKASRAIRTKLKKQTEKCEIREMYSDEWQDCIEDIEESQHCESMFQSLGEFMLFLMGNEGLRHIADKIFSASVPRYGGRCRRYVIDMETLANCRLVSRAFRDYIDNQRALLQVQIRHFERFELSCYTEECHSKYTYPFNDWGEYGYGLIDYIAKEVKDVSKLRTFLGLLREIASDRCHALVENPFKYMVDNHMHKELELLMNSPLPIYPPEGWGEWVDDAQEWPSFVSLYACGFGCGDCVQPFLDHIGEKFIDVNWNRRPCIHAAFENDFEKGEGDGHRFRKRVLPLLLQNASKKGIDVNATWRGETVKDKVIEKYKWDLEHDEDGEGDLCKYAFGLDDYEVYKILGINTDDYEKSDSDEDSNSDSNSNSTSNPESNSDTQSETDPNT